MLSVTVTLTSRQGDGRGAPPPAGTWKQYRSFLWLPELSEQDRTALPTHRATSQDSGPNVRSNTGQRTATRGQCRACPALASRTPKARPTQVWPPSTEGAARQTWRVRKSIVAARAGVGAGRDCSGREGSLWGRAGNSLNLHCGDGYTTH